MRIAVDFDDASRAGRVPRHGWAKNSQGVKLLWLPVLRLVHEANTVRKTKGLPEMSRGQYSEIRAFEQTVQRFALTLRELAKCVRIGSDPCFDEGDDEKMNASKEAHSLIPLYVDLAFIYARRLADHFVRASRFVLFTHLSSTPLEYKKLRPIIADQTKLQNLGPICDAKVLREAFDRHSGWLDRLRDPENDTGELQGGIRDIMEHHPGAVTVQNSQVGDGPWEVIVNLGEHHTAIFRPDLIPTLKVIVTDIACLWTMVCDSAGLSAAGKLWVAPYGDAVLLTGNDDDSTAFWPESQA